MIEEVVFAGFGGQGILLTGQMVANAAMLDGHYATWLPSYGPEMRGGTCNCMVVYASEEIGSPVPSSFSAAVVMNQPSLDKFAPTVRSGGDLFVNSSLITVADRRPDVNYVMVPANDLAQASGADRSANMVMLGAYNAGRGIIQPQTVERVCREFFNRKGPQVVEVNRRALVAGAATVTEVRS